MMFRQHDPKNASANCSHKNKRENNTAACDRSHKDPPGKPTMTTRFVMPGGFGSCIMWPPPSAPCTSAAGISKELPARQGPLRSISLACLAAGDRARRQALTAGDAGIRSEAVNALRLMR